MKISPQWLAGFFDGEGCINITVAGRQRRCILRLYLVNTNYELLKVIQSEYGGQITRRKTKAGWKPFCALIWTNIQAKNLLDKIGEFIILKDKQLSLAREFLALRSDPNRYQTSSILGVPRKQREFRRKLADWIVDTESSMKERMHFLNRKGVSTDAIQ